MGCKCGVCLCVHSLQSAVWLQLVWCPRPVVHSWRSDYSEWDEWQLVGGQHWQSVGNVSCQLRHCCGCTWLSAANQHTRCMLLLESCLSLLIKYVKGSSCSSSFTFSVWSIGDIAASSVHCFASEMTYIVSGWALNSTHTCVHCWTTALPRTWSILCRVGC